MRLQTNSYETILLYNSKRCHIVEVYYVVAVKGFTYVFANYRLLNYTSVDKTVGE